MAEPIGIASGLVALAGFAFQASVTLYNLVQSFQFHPKRVRDLKDELEALTGVLSSLTETVSATTDVDLSALELPLLRCGNSCKDFVREIEKCTTRSGGNRTSFRDWAKLKYMGDDIDGFTQLLAGYKSTIIIALTDANLRKSSVTAESLEAYRGLIKTATDDIESHLQSINEKLDTVFERTVTGSVDDAAEMQLIKEERMSAQKCLQIIAQLSEHIDEIQLTPGRDSGSPEPTNADSIPKRLTSTGLQECKNSLAVTAAKLEGYMKDRMDRLITKSRIAMTSEDDYEDLLRLREQWETARQCMDICSRADKHLKENITAIDNYGLGDAMQFMVSTDGTIIRGSNKGLGWRTRQVGGHLSDATVQKLSGDMTSIHFQKIENGSVSWGNGVSPGSNSGVENNPRPEFKERYGPGFKLTSNANGGISMSPPSGQGGPSSPPKG